MLGERVRVRKRAHGVDGDSLEQLVVALSFPVGPAKLHHSFDDVVRVETARRRVEPFGAAVARRVVRDDVRRGHVDVSRRAPLARQMHHREGRQRVHAHGQVDGLVKVDRGRVVAHNVHALAGEPFAPRGRDAQNAQWRPRPQKIYHSENR